MSTLSPALRAELLYPVDVGKASLAAPPAIRRYLEALLDGEAPLALLEDLVIATNVPAYIERVRDLVPGADRQRLDDALVVVTVMAS